MYEFFFRATALLVIVVPLVAGATDIQQAYVGKSSCGPGLQGHTGSYGIRLDKTQAARLEARTSKGRNVLMIVQYKKESDDCGTVRDIIETADNSTSFLFECVDDKDPGSVVIGTWKTPKVSGRSLQSWRIDLHDLRFVPIER